MDTELLTKEFTKLRRRPHANTYAINAIEQWIRQTTPEQRYRINLFAIARDIGVEMYTTLPEFLHGVHIGLFDLHWDLHCPQCDMVIDEHSSLSTMAGRGFCHICDKQFAADFAKHIEVTFSLNRAIEDTITPPQHVPPKSFKYHFYMDIPQHQTKRVQETLSAGSYHYHCLPSGAGGTLLVSGKPHQEVQEISLMLGEDDRFSTAQLTTTPGEVALTITNHHHPILTFVVVPHNQGEAKAEDLPMRLSGLHLIHFPEFHDLFGQQVLSEREQLRITSITTIFTDITGSTQMYDRLGDATAYNIVRDHFDILFEAIEQHGGRVVKTIGDAVMASFIRNHQAVQSIVSFLRRLDEYNQRRSDNEHIILKIGIHRGPSILVNLNGHLDYFGSHINKAARIQGLSKSGEITMSEEIFEDETSQRIFAEAGMTAFVKETVNLKGIEGEQTVYKISVREHT
jgi:class 3 adenylate cyclase